MFLSELSVGHRRLGGSCHIQNINAATRGRLETGSRSVSGFKSRGSRTRLSHTGRMARCGGALGGRERTGAPTQLGHALAPGHAHHADFGQSRARQRQRVTPWAREALPPLFLARASEGEARRGARPLFRFCTPSPPRSASLVESFDVRRRRRRTAFGHATLFGFVFMDDCVFVFGSFTFLCLYACFFFFGNF